MFIESLDRFLNDLKEIIWGAPLLLFILGTGVYLTFLLRGFQFRYLGYAFKQAFMKAGMTAKGDISPFESLMTSLAGAIGTGTIVGVATAISIGGFGAIFWMWVTAIFSLATKYAESMLAVKYRVIDKRGEMLGGPMEYMEKGLGWKWIAVVFAVLGVLATLGTGNLVQVNSIADAIDNVWGINPWISGVVIAIAVGVVLIGGVKSIGQVASVLVPFMALLYAGGGLIIIAMHYERIPEAFGLILNSAFNGQAAFGGFAGSTVMLTIQLGVARSIFSNEAGLGLSTMAAAAAKTDSPPKQALITMTGAVLSTLFVCTVTGLVFAVTDVHGKVLETGDALKGANMAISAFESTLFAGRYVVTVGLVLFAFTTVLAWAYYGEKCAEYLFGEKSIRYYRLLFTLVIIPGAAINMEAVWTFADITNGLMAIPNLIALIALSSVIVSETKKFLLEEEGSVVSRS